MGFGFGVNTIFYVRNTDCAANDTLCTAVTYDWTQWQHIASCNNISKSFLYILEVNTNTSFLESKLPYTFSDKSLFFNGGLLERTTTYGFFKDLRIWNIGLTLSEISRHAHRKDYKATGDLDLLLFLPFDETMEKSYMLVDHSVYRGFNS